MDGLRKVTSDYFYLAFVDINMAVTDGLKLISLIRGESAEARGLISLGRHGPPGAFIGQICPKPKKLPRAGAVRWWGLAFS